jgi:hypothetical protein
MIAHSESPDEKISHGLNVIDGQILKYVSVQPETGNSAFYFEFGEVLKTSPYEHLDSEGQPFDNWLLFLPDGNVLTYRADGKYSYHPADGVESEQAWYS